VLEARELPDFRPASDPELGGLEGYIVESLPGRGGTDAYVNLIGHGVDNGTASGGIGVGQITGWVLQG
jgi:hypothetical protein